MQYAKCRTYFFLTNPCFANPCPTNSVLSSPVQSINQSLIATNVFHACVFRTRVLKLLFLTVRIGVKYLRIYNSIWLMTSSCVQLNIWFWSLNYHLLFPNLSVCYPTNLKVSEEKFDTIRGVMIWDINLTDLNDSTTDWHWQFLLVLHERWKEEKKREMNSFIISVRLFYNDNDDGDGDGDWIWRRRWWFLWKCWRRIRWYDSQSILSSRSIIFCFDNSTP